MDYTTQFGTIKVSVKFGTELAKQLYFNTLYRLELINKVWEGDTVFNERYITYDEEIKILLGDNDTDDTNDDTHKPKKLVKANKSLKSAKVVLTDDKPKKATSVNVNLKTKLIYLIKCAVFEVSNFKQFDSIDNLIEKIESDCDNPVFPFMYAIHNKYHAVIQSKCDPHFMDFGIKDLVYAEFKKCVYNISILTHLSAIVSSFVVMFSQFMTNHVWVNLQKNAFQMSSDHLTIFMLTMNDILDVPLSMSCIALADSYIRLIIDSKKASAVASGAVTATTINVVQNKFNDSKLLGGDDPSDNIDKDITITTDDNDANIDDADATINNKNTSIKNPSKAHKRNKRLIRADDE